MITNRTYIFTIFWKDYLGEIFLDEGEIMKKQFILLILSVFLCSCTRIPDTTQPVPQMETNQIPVSGCEVGVNLLENGDFSDDEEHWGSFKEGGGADLIFSNGCLQVDIKTLGFVKHGVQVYYDGFRLIKGGEYSLSFTAFASESKYIEVRPQLNGGDYHAYIEQEFRLTEEAKTYNIDFTMTEETDVVPRLAINMGLFPDDIAQAPVTITISDVSLVLHNEVIEKHAESNNILVNQIGYAPDAKKIAFFHGEVMDTQFRVVNEDGKVVYRGEIGNMVENKAAGEYTFLGDFSKVKKDGVYHIETTSLGSSETFRIGDGLYHNAFIDTVRMLYLQRCGCEIPQEFGEDFAHTICHNTTARINGTSDYIDVIGGWHDAGDYGRYTVPAAKTVTDLLLAYRSVPEAFSDDTNIPESGNGVPDVLDEVRYELEWMLQMQNDKGGVYHKITCADFPRFVMPQEETDRLIISPVSTCATADFAAVMAMSYSDYYSIDPTFAQNCLEAAQEAWEFLEMKKNISFHNPMNIVTGEYGDSSDEDERYFAAVALYEATGDEKYHDAFKSLLKDTFAKDLGWKDMGGYGNALYISLGEEKTDDATYEKIKSLILAQADELCTTSQANGYHVSIDEYVWGSNMIVLNNAMLLIMANDLQEDSRYIDVARAQIDYIFGTNVLSVSYLTAYGATPALNPHHRPSIVVESAMPGMLIGGPDENLEDPTASIALEGFSPAKCYLDNAQSYSTNEVTTYWNSPLVYVMARLGIY